MYVAVPRSRPPIVSIMPFIQPAHRGWERLKSINVLMADRKERLRTCPEALGFVEDPLPSRLRDIAPSM